MRSSAVGSAALGLVVAGALLGCVAARPAASTPASASAPRLASTAAAPRVDRAPDQAPLPLPPPPIVVALAAPPPDQNANRSDGFAANEADAEGPARLAKGARSLSVPAGRSLVVIDVTPGCFISIGVLGNPTALLGFDVVNPPSARAVAAHGALDEDGLLPKIVSFRAPLGVDEVTVVVDLVEPALIARASGDPASLPAEIFSDKPPKKLPVFPLVGLPAPASRDDGYFVQSPSRYQFIRMDVAVSLLAALRQTRVRFRRDPIAIADISQWDGLRPATDLGKPRHISHEGGRDIDVALPASDGEASTVRAHCDGVLVEADVQGCAPGTARGFDALRAAYFLGLLFDGPPPGRVERVFTDDAYVREIRRAAETLRRRRWIKDDGFEGLFDDSRVRPSPWHVDHMHIRFAGTPGRSPFAP